MLTKTSQTEPTFYTCKKCDYNTNKINNYNRHIKSKRHNANKMLTKTSQETHNNCICGKEYKHYSSLSRHKKVCKYKSYEEEGDDDREKDASIYMKNMIDKKDVKNTNKSNKSNDNIEYPDINITQLDTKNDIDYKELIFKLMEQNQKLLATTIELANKPQIINNNQFNIMNYLNNECKDAINFTEFIEQLKYTVSDLSELPNEGWQQNVTNTLIRQLQSIDETKRPIHCSDKKRKTFYIKDDDKWDRDIERKKLYNGLQKFHDKQCNTYLNWKINNKSILDKSDKLYTTSMYMQIELCKPHHENGEKMKNKIITGLADLTINKRIIE